MLSIRGWVLPALMVAIVAVLWAYGDHVSYQPPVIRVDADVLRRAMEACDDAELEGPSYTASAASASAPSAGAPFASAPSAGSADGTDVSVNPCFAPFLPGFVDEASAQAGASDWQDANPA